MKKRLATDSILREKKGQWWKNIGCIINCKSSFWISQCSQGPNSFLTFLKMSQGYFKFTRVLRACLATPIKNITITFKKTFMFINTQNINFLTQFFFAILQRHCVFVILSTSGMPSPSLLSWNIEKIVKTYHLGNLGRPGHARQD